MKYLRAFLKKLIELIDKELANQKRINEETKLELYHAKNEIYTLRMILTNQTELLKKQRCAINSQKEKIRMMRNQIT